jgi:hypothetical protein
MIAACPCTAVAQMLPNTALLHRNRAFHVNVTCGFRTPGIEIGNFANLRSVHKPRLWEFLCAVQGFGTRAILDKIGPRDTPRRDRYTFGEELLPVLSFTIDTGGPRIDSGAASG